MLPSLDQILPSLQSLGLLSYWLIGLAALLESFFLTGVIVPGTLAVDAGGILVQRGVLDFFDLVWFVAVGAILGGEISFRAGRTIAGRLSGRFDPRSYTAFQRANNLFIRRGPLALIIGRFAGPVSGLVPFAAALTDIPYRRFAIWNGIGGIVFAFFHVGLGYFLGDTLSRLGSIASRGLLLVAVGVAAVALLWVVVLRVWRALPFLMSLAASVRDAVTTNPDVRLWVARHPRLTAFTTERFDRSRFAGLTATVLSVAFVYILTIYAGSVLDFLLQEPIVQVDVRLANLIHAFWNIRALRIATFLTALGDARTVASLFVGIIVLLVAHGRLPLAAGLGVTVLGNVATVALLKMMFDRPRPELRYFIETTGSFPSGHAAIGVAFYGMLAFLAYRLRVLGPVPALLIAVTLPFLIGFSRIYLLEHYLSDVLNGYLIGAMWLVVGIAAAEWLTERNAAQLRHPPPPAVLRQLAAGAMMAATLAAGWVVYAYDKPLSPALTAPVPTVAADVAVLFQSGTVPALTETITGAPQEPINLVITARSADDLAAAMARAGWHPADAPSLATLSRAAWAAWTNQPDPTAPVTPYFWRGVPNPLAFQRPTDDPTLRKRHHVRFWPSGSVAPGGAAIFVGAASFDDGLDWGVTHHIDPNLDAERDYLADGLRKTGFVRSTAPFQATAAQMGQNFNGDAWFTDGIAVHLTLLP